ncbi:hypothetical protein KHA94_13520 [Bacillus sp. FJAT-49705]|uniref:Uncharacterized protein n=1 Tax=Cytobacillus citreus TaxID=2833586 RepID=A0ABS5NTQ5_9BACI|nr:hypothetical protein [Cytobacillus citreus]MBS4191203.1 hypothetical protein [Cytobacillus citreus]
MNRLNTFIQSLEELKTISEQTDKEFKGLLFNLAFLLGKKDSISINSTDELKSRIEYLIKEENVREKFLINALVNEVNNHFEHFISSHGEIILNNEYLANSYREEFGMVPEHIQNGLDQSKDKSFLFTLEEQYDSWKLIVIKNFSKAQQRQWDRDEFKQASKTN